MLRTMIKVPLCKLFSLIWKESSEAPNAEEWMKSVRCCGTGRHSHLQGSFGVGLYCKNTKNFCFCFLPLICFQIDIMTRFCCTKHRGKKRRSEKQESRQTRPIYMYCIFSPPAWLPVCLATRLVLKQLHVAIYLPPSQMDLCHFGRCFTALIHCSNCFMLAHVGFTMETASLGHFILMQFLVSLLPNLSLKHDEKLMMTQFSGLNAQNTWNDSMLTDSHCGGYGGV